MWITGFEIPSKPTAAQEFLFNDWNLEFRIGYFQPEFVLAYILLIYFLIKPLIKSLKVITVVF